MSTIWPHARLTAFASALPWEYRLRGLSFEAAQARWQMEATTALSTPLLPAVGLLLLTGGGCEEWLRTLASWHLQTAPTAEWWVLGSDQEPWRGEREAAGLPEPQGCLSRFDTSALSSRGVDWALAARGGDLLHPSLAWSIALAARDGCEAVGWDWLVYDDSISGFHLQARHRAPWCDVVRELTVDARGRAFALPVAAWEGFPDVGAWQVRMAMRTHSETGAVTIVPEPLGMYREAPAAESDADLGYALKVAQSCWGAPFCLRPDGQVAPVVAAASVSVVLMYRDRPEITIRALKSVLAQRFDGVLEVVLVDNDSSEDTRHAITNEIAQSVGVHFALISAPGAFNHSAQAALAAEAAGGEVLLWLNNDACLLGEDAVDQMARWARLPRVASVGVAVTDASGAVVGGAMRARRTPGAEFNSPVEEASGAGAGHARQTIGNTFACAAVSASAWRALGGLDAARFPAGYNDVDYCLRAVAQGWTHVNLGHVHVHHEVGSSRARQDEIAQKAWLRSQHPWTLVHALQESSCEVLDLRLPALPRFAPIAEGALPRRQEPTSNAQHPDMA